MTRTRIKFCGITRVEDAERAAQLGVDAIGLVFAAASKRRVKHDQARSIRMALPPFVSVVALFMNDNAARVKDVIDVVRPDVLQFHGEEDDTWCAQFGLRYIKAIGMGAGAPAATDLHAYPRAAALLLDGHVSGGPGGQGRAFDWSLVPRNLPRPVILAGGLDPGNVAAAIRDVHPWAVDVASGVESAPGIKDAVKMQRFATAVHDSTHQPVD